MATLSEAPKTATPATRVEEDLLGQRHVPADAYYGIHTLRAVENFNISNVTISDVPEFVRGMMRHDHDQKSGHSGKQRAGRDS